MNVIFGSRLSSCKTPFGAVKTGETITFHIYPGRELGVTQASLIISRDGEAAGEHPMMWRGLDGARDNYTVRYQAKQTGLFWYYFCIQTTAGEQIISRGEGGQGILNDALTANFQLTVTDPAYKTPAWFGEGITYNIFPDRFRRTAVPAADGLKGTRHIHENWDDMPEYRPNEQGEILNNDFFGGNFAGIEEKLPYLKSLSVSTIYLNPIFEAASNHRYDTGDYKSPDPMLGTEAEFQHLCAAAKKMGIRILLDGVFSHTGYDSRYFNAKGHYDSVGAYQSEQSPYFDWYAFQKWPDQYSSWWGIYTLPQVNELNAKYLYYMTEGQDAVVRRWLKLGASGWRLDVADELPDEFIKHVNQAARETCEDAIVLGEVWEDASNKVSYGVRRQYFEGGELDSVMNYPLRDAIISFLQGGKAEDFVEKMETIRENYPKDVFMSLMNSISTHDTPRALTVLGNDAGAWKESRDYRAHSVLAGEALEGAKRRLHMAAVIQFTMPGSPCIYYGDEACMQGYEDPFNRRTYPWGREDAELIEFYRRLSAVRDASVALKKGNLRFLIGKDGVLAYKRSYRGEDIVVVVNRGCAPRDVAIPFGEGEDLMTGESYTGGSICLHLDGESAMVLRCGSPQ